MKSGLAVFPAKVPGNLELDLLANGIIEEPFFGMNVIGLQKYERANVWYARSFPADPPSDMESLLIFEGIDCYADIYLNGEQIGSTDNMLVEHSFPVALKPENELLVHILPTMELARQYQPAISSSGVGQYGYHALHVRKAPHTFGWDIMPRLLSAGLWRTVKLAYQPHNRLENVYLETISITPDGTGSQLILHYQARLNGMFGDQSGENVFEVELNGKCGNSCFTKRARALFEAGRMSITVQNPRLWQPKGRGDACLYSVQARLLKNGEEADCLSFTHGVRTVELIRSSVTNIDGKGEFLFRVNGEKLFIMGGNWVPADALHSRDLERIPAILELAEEIGCNMLRCWGGNVYENDLFYDICDRKGILVWQDFTMACAVYPQGDSFQERLRAEARKVIRRLRQHACIALWAGDNECDQAYSWGGRGNNPNVNRLTRETLPQIIREEDGARPYLPSSPYVDQTAYETGERFLPENHLWGPRDYYKSDYYTQSLCHFASEIGYHGCPAPESIARFISPGKLWPCLNNEEWTLHSTSPEPGNDLRRVELMSNQARELFGEIPDNLNDFSFASQASQAEALKFFIEMFRAAKWRRTGILWWNLMDGWPQMSDAVVDYYFHKKLAFSYIQRSQSSLCLVIREPRDWRQEVVACNDTRNSLSCTYVIQDVETREVIFQGKVLAQADEVTRLGSIPYSASRKRFYRIAWNSELGKGTNHYLAGNPPFSLEQYRCWLELLEVQDENSC